MKSPTRLVAILNLTPDSFSDGGIDMSEASVLARVEQLIEEEADIIDVGAESTRPNAEPLSAEEEWGRLKRVLPQIVSRCRKEEVLVSVDTRHAEVALQALQYDVDWINDVNGFRDAAMVEAVKDSNCQLVATHSLSVPVDPAITIDEEDDPIEVVADWCEDRLLRLAKHGIMAERVILDPGIGFGKTAQQSLALLMGAYHALSLFDCEVMIGHSRKSFLSLFTDEPAEKRDALTLAFSSMLKLQGVDYVRVHNVRVHAELFGKL